MAFSMLSSDDHFGSGGGDHQFGNYNMHASNFNFLPFNSPSSSSSAFDLHHQLMNNNPSCQWYGSTSSFSLNHSDGTATVTRQLMFADGRQQQQLNNINLSSYFSTTGLSNHPPPALPFGPNFLGGGGVVVERSVVETVTFRPLAPPPLRRGHVGADHASPYYHPTKTYIMMDIDDQDEDGFDYDIKPLHNLLHFPPPALPQNNNNNNNSVSRLQIEGRNKNDDDIDDGDDGSGRKNRTDEYKTRSLKHKKYGPYTCPRCKREIETSQSFASHMKSHYSSESEEERKKRMEAKYKKKNLRVAVADGGQLTLLPKEGSAV